MTPAKYIELLTQLTAAHVVSRQTDNRDAVKVARLTLDQILEAEQVAAQLQSFRIEKQPTDQPGASTTAFDDQFRPDPSR